MTSRPYANVIINISHEKVDRPFQYHIPEALQGQVKLGSCVSVPFGAGNTERLAYVVELMERPACAPEKIKDILSLREKDLPADALYIELAAWMRRRYGSTMIRALKTVLPVSKKKQEKVYRTIELILSREKAGELLVDCRRQHKTAQLRLLTELLEQQNHSLPYSLVTEKLGVSAPSVNGLVKVGAVRILSETVYRNPVAALSGQKKQVELSPDQKAISNRVLEDYRTGRRGTYLIHGITGSGKTEVYIDMIEQMVALGKQAIVLIPEIALTYQTLMRFYRHFGDRVSVMNSTLSEGEKYDQTERARKGEIDVIIGPRSALFTPFRNLGLIIIDEEHESSYKSENMPRYHARETAEQLCRMIPGGASLVLGSATPSLESYDRAMRGEITLFELTERLTGGSLPQVEIADLRQELAQGNRSIFSRALQEKLTDRLQKKEQSMLFLNRRGLAGFVSCRACGHVFKCPHCDVSLSEHRGKLQCHYCGYEEPIRKICPVCGQKWVMAFRAGTEKVEQEVHRLYPEARTLRMDADTTARKGSYEKILSAFAAGEADILIGTQMIVKGHDFPNVTLVGILAADMSLYAADYRASERTFQLLTQAAGRAGRGTLPGEVVIQSYQPEHYSIQAAARQDFKGFYAEEIQYRRLLQYPPASHLLLLQILAAREADAASAAGALANFLKRRCQADPAPVLIGPAPAAFQKLQDTYRYAIYIKHPDAEVLSDLKDMADQAFTAMLESSMARGMGEVRLQFDFDPMNGF